jgi:ketosteroid isomerase-like protein
MGSPPSLESGAKLGAPIEADPMSSDRIETHDVDTVRAGYARWNSGDMAALAELFTEDIEYQNSPEWPGQRTYHGADAVIRFLRDEVAEIIALRPVEVVRTDVIEDEILIELRARTHGRLSGVDLDDASLFHVARMRNGRVSRVRVYLDRQAATRAATTGIG